MNLAPPFAPPFIRVIEHVDRRILGAFQLVDAVTQLPVVSPARIEVKGASLSSGDDVPFGEGSVEVRQTRSGFWAIKRAPFFDEYTSTFDDPKTPPGVANKTLRLRIAVTDPGPHYLPQEFQFDLPRGLDNRDIFKPVRVPLFRAPAAPVVGGWAVLRAQVATAQGAPLGAVLVRVFTHPRGANASPIGRGMSDWRGRLRGEALVIVPNLPRFRANDQPDQPVVIIQDQEIQFELVRDPNFTGAGNEFPDAARLVAGTANGLVTLRSDAAAAPKLGVVPAVPIKIRAGQELSVGLTTP